MYIKQDVSRAYISFLTFPTFLLVHFVVCRLESRHANVFCLLPSLLSSDFLPYRLSPGLAIAALVCLKKIHFPPTVICNIFLVASSLSRLSHVLVIQNYQTTFTHCILFCVPNFRACPIHFFFHVPNLHTYRRQIESSGVLPVPLARSVRAQPGLETHA